MGTNLKWGTRQPILYRDDELNMVRLRAFGIQSVQIADPMVFLNKVAGTRGIYEDSDIVEYLASISTTRLTSVFGEQIKSVFDLPKDFDALSVIVRTALASDFAGLGLTLHDFLITSVSVPPEVQEMVDARAGMAAVGNLDEYLKFKLARAVEIAAGNTGGGAGVGMGIGAGAGMGFMIPQAIQGALQSGSLAQDSPLEKLKQLKELLELGAISADEFNEHKAKLLAKL